MAKITRGPYGSLTVCDTAANRITGQIILYNIEQVVEKKKKKYRVAAAEGKLREKINGLIEKSLPSARDAPVKKMKCPQKCKYKVLVGSSLNTTHFKYVHDGKGTMTGGAFAEWILDINCNSTRPKAKEYKVDKKTGCWVSKKKSKKKGITKKTSKKKETTSKKTEKRG